MKEDKQQTTLIKPAKAAAMLDCGVGRIYKFIREGQLAVKYLGADIRIEVSSLDALIQSLPEKTII